MSSKILVADDERGHIKLLEFYARRMGIRNPIRRFQDGQEILDYILDESGTCASVGNTEDKPGMLFLDIRMPKVDGIEVLRQIRETRCFRNLPIVMLTTTDNPQEMDVCRKNGCNGFITKPLSYDTFAATVRSFLDSPTSSIA